MKARTKLFFVAALGLWALCGSVWAVEGSGPIAHWKFDEGEGSIAYDSAGDNDGAIYGAVWTTGQVDGALSFDGNRDYVMVGDGNNLEPQEFTLSFWAKLNNPSGRFQGGIAKGYVFGNVYEFSYRMDFHLNQIRAGITNTTNTVFNTYATIEDTDWHLWTMTVGANGVTLYGNGTLQDSIEYTGAIDYTKTHNNFVISARDNGSYAFNGVIDDVSIYDRVLSAEEIHQLYQDGLSSYERAVINIEDAIAEKEEALERIDVALEKERAAVKALNELLRSGDYDDLNKKDIFKAKKKIRFAIRLEKWSKRVLKMSIKKLEEAMDALGWEPEPLPEPIAYWKFDEGEGSVAYDSVGDNDGTVYGTVWTTGQVDGALSFDGNRDYVMVGDGNNLEPQEFTLSFWAKLNNPSGRFQGGIAKGYIFGSPREFSYRMDFTSGYLRAGITNTENIAFGNFGSFISIEDNNWHMWTMTVGDGNVSIYKDGLIADTAEYTGTIDYTKSHNNFVIGARDSGSYAFDGTIDDVQFYDQTLSADQIQQLYEDGLGG